jgi:hypothetical protein
MGEYQVPLKPPVKEEIQGTTAHGRWGGVERLFPVLFCAAANWMYRDPTDP